MKIYCQLYFRGMTLREAGVVTFLFRSDDLHQAKKIFPSLSNLHSLVFVLGWRVGRRLYWDYTFRSYCLSCICLTCGQKDPKRAYCFFFFFFFQAIRAHPKQHKTCLIHV